MLWSRADQLSGPRGSDSRWRWDFDGALDYRFAIANGSLRELVDPSGERGLPVSGGFTTRGKIAGTTEQALIDGWMSSADVTWKQRVLGPLRLEAKAVGRDGVVEGTVIPGLDGTLSMSMRNEWPFQARLSVQSEDLSAFFPESVPSLGVRLKGTVGQWSDA